MTDNILTYVRRIRNERKREYAIAYALWRFRSQADAEVREPKYNLSYMGAQSVRMAIDKMADGKTEVAL